MGSLDVHRAIVFDGDDGGKFVFEQQVVFGAMAFGHEFRGIEGVWDVKPVPAGGIEVKPGGTVGEGESIAVMVSIDPEDEAVAPDLS